MAVVTNWCGDTGLQLAQEKAEVILLTGMRIPKEIRKPVTW
jgi:hypothetical protein